MVIHASFTCLLLPLSTPNSSILSQSLRLTLSFTDRAIFCKEISSTHVHMYHVTSRTRKPSLLTYNLQKKLETHQTDYCGRRREVSRRLGWTYYREVWGSSGCRWCRRWGNGRLRRWTGRQSASYVRTDTTLSRVEPSRCGLGGRSHLNRK